MTAFTFAIAEIVVCCLGYIFCNFFSMTFSARLTIPRFTLIRDTAMRSISIIFEIFAFNRFIPCIRRYARMLTGILCMTARAFAIIEVMFLSQSYSFRYEFRAVFSARLTIPRFTLIHDTAMRSISIILPIFAFNRLIPCIRRYARMLTGILCMTSRTFAITKVMLFNLRYSRNKLTAPFAAIRAVPSYSLIRDTDMRSISVVLPILAFNRLIPRIVCLIRMGALILIAAYLANITVNIRVCSVCPITL